MKDIKKWLVQNYGPRCTLVCAATALRFMGAQSHRLISILEKGTGFTERFGPRLRAYMGMRPPLDRAIQRAGLDGGVAVRSQTRFLFTWRRIVESIDNGVPVVLNCFRAPGGKWSHSVLATAYELKTHRLLTLDPNDGEYRWMTWRKPRTGWICTATFIKRSK